MAIWLTNCENTKTAQLLAKVIVLCKRGARVKFLVEPGQGEVIVQRFRVALSRSRKRNEERGKKIEEFTLKHSTHPYTEKGKRHDCIVLWIEKQPHHTYSEMLDDLLERD